MGGSLRKNDGFSLIEILIVLVMMGILASIALPSYQSSVAKSRRADGKAALLDLSARSEKFFAQNNTYTTEISATTGLALGRTTSADGYYNLGVAACASGTIARCYLLTATATGVHDNDTDCASLSLDNVGRKTAKNSDGTAVDYCW
jgi:type IV pilus assembly protein PilE